MDNKLKIKVTRIALSNEEEQGFDIQIRYPYYIDDCGYGLRNVVDQIKEDISYGKWFEQYDKDDDVVYEEYIRRPDGSEIKIYPTGGNSK